MLGAMALWRKVFHFGPTLAGSVAYHFHELREEQRNQNNLIHAVHICMPNPI